METEYIEKVKLQMNNNSLPQRKKTIYKPQTKATIEKQRITA